MLPEAKASSSTTATGGRASHPCLLQAIVSHVGISFLPAIDSTVVDVVERQSACRQHTNLHRTRIVVQILGIAWIQRLHWQLLQRLYHCVVLSRDIHNAMMASGALQSRTPPRNESRHTW